MHRDVPLAPCKLEVVVDDRLQLDHGVDARLDEIGAPVAFAGLVAELDDVVDALGDDAPFADVCVVAGELPRLAGGGLNGLCGHWWLLGVGGCVRPPTARPVVGQNQGREIRSTRRRARCGHVTRDLDGRGCLRSVSLVVAAKGSAYRPSQPVVVALVELGVLAAARTHGRSPVRGRARRSHPR